MFFEDTEDVFIYFKYLRRVRSLYKEKKVCSCGQITNNMLKIKGTQGMRSHKNNSRNAYGEVIEFISLTFLIC